MRLPGLRARLAFWALLLALLGGSIAWMVRMPGRSHSGPLPPAMAVETEIEGRLRRHVQALAGRIGERNLRRYPALQAAADYVAASLGEAGGEVRSEVFSVEGLDVRNLLLDRPGAAAGEIVVVGAHYDSVIGSPGANDNASGVAAVLEIARLFQGKRHRRTLRFAAFVNEEPPYFQTDAMGSLHHATRARERGERIAAMLSIETIGYYSDAPGSQAYPFPLGLLYPSRGDFIGFVGDTGSRGLVRRAVGSFRSHTAFPSEGAAVPGAIPGVSWSDHWAFRQAGYPGIMVTDTALFRYPAYHSLEDTPEKLDYGRMARVVAGLLRVTEDLAGAGP